MDGVSLMLKFPLPFNATGPDHAPDPDAEVELVQVPETVVDWPRVIVVGDAPMLAVGGGGTDP